MDGKSRIAAALLCCAVALFLPRAAGAQAPAPDQQRLDVKSDFGKLEEVKMVQWKLSSSLGFSWAYGNANAIALSGGLSFSRTDPKNRIALDINGAYGVAQTFVLTPSAVNGMVATDADVDTSYQLNVGFALGKFRYDRFFTPHNSLYLAALVGTDFPASKVVHEALEIGYSRTFVKTKSHEFRGELGIDFIDTLYRAPDSAPTDPNGYVYHNVPLGAARAALAYVLTVNDTSALSASVETLINLNPVNTTGYSAEDKGVAQASRLNGKLEFTTKLWKILSLRLAYNARFDNAPGLDSKIKFDPTKYFGAYRLNQRLDMQTELGLVANFL